MDLTETEKYLNCTNNSSSDSDTVEVAQDTLLGGIRSGLSAITRTARKDLSTCENIAELDNAAQRIQESSLKLLKLEQSFLKSASIVSDVIEDLVSDFEDDDEICHSCFLQEVSHAERLSRSSIEKGGSGDACSNAKPQPYVFRVSETNASSILNFKDKLTKEFHKRMGQYETTLTDFHLKKDEKFTKLLDQIQLGKNDAKILMKKSDVTEVGGTAMGKNDYEEENSVSSFLSSLPYTATELLNYPYKPYNEDDDMDHSVLPTIDPITKSHIRFPLKNKYCNHVFDRDSIYSYIASNPKATCPIYMCRNKRAMEKDHFVFDSILSTHVRQQNNFE